MLDEAGIHAFMLIYATYLPPILYSSCIHPRSIVRLSSNHSAALSLSTKIGRVINLTIFCTDPSFLESIQIVIT
jgi:hypothetical protein